MIDRRQLVSPTGDIYMPSKLFNTDASALTYSTNNQNILCWAEKHDEGESFPDYLILDFDIDTNNTSITLSLNAGYMDVLSGDVLIDWGDNSSTSFSAGTALSYTTSHTYADAGKYSVKIYGKAWCEFRNYGSNPIISSGSQYLTRVYGTYNINDRKTVALTNSEVLGYFFNRSTLTKLKEFNIEIPTWKSDIDCTVSHIQSYIFYNSSASALEKFRFVCKGLPNNYKVNSDNNNMFGISYVNGAANTLKTIEIETGEFPAITNINSLKTYAFRITDETNTYYNNVEEITFKIPTTLPSNADLTNLTFANNGWYYNLFTPFKNLQKIKKFKFVELPFDTNPLVNYGGNAPYQYAFVCRDVSYITDNNMYTVKFEGENGEKLTATDIINGNPARSNNTNCFSTYVIDPTDWNNLPTTWRSSS